MLFLIDYENVHNEGMRGCDLLEPSDSLILFYSSAAKNMEYGYLEEIEHSACRFELIRLVQEGKNALDFYIASYLGRAYGEGLCDPAVIVSKDGGFSAVRDYWGKCDPGKHQVFLAQDIENGLLKAEGGTARTKQLEKRKKATDIQAYYAGFRERRKLRERLGEIFVSTEYQNRVPEICHLVENSKSAKILYLDTLKRFGRKQGLDVYRQLKNIPICGNSTCVSKAGG